VNHLKQKNAMKLKWIYFALAFCSFISSANAQDAANAEVTKMFPEAQCSYTLPGDDWKWADPAILQQHFTDATTLAAAFKTTGLFVALRFNRLKQDERTDPRSLESFEKGLLQSGRMTKRREGKHLSFKGLPTYQIDVTLKNGQECSIRVFIANDKMYQLMVVSLGKLGSDEEIEPTFQGFNLTGQAQNPMRNRTPDEQAFEAGKRAAPFCIVIFMGGLAAFIGLILVVVKLHKREDVYDDERPRHRRRHRRDDDDDDDEIPRRRNPGRDETEHDEDRPPRRRDSRDDEDDRDDEPPRRRRKPRRDDDD
jgi:hypothetical protein